MPYEVNEAKRLVIEAGKKLIENGLIARTWGNVSARISDTQYCITPSGMPYETLTPDKIVVVNIADNSYEGDIKPSTEKKLHSKLYALRPDVDFMIHTHQKAASAISTTGTCFAVPEEAGEGSRVVSNADDGISAVGFEMSDDGGSVKMDATISVVLMLSIIIRFENMLSYHFREKPEKLVMDFPSLKENSTR